MVGVDGETDMSEDQEAELSADLEVVIRERGDRGRGRGGRRPRRVVYGPALPTRADLAAAAREERDTQLRVI